MAIRIAIVGLGRLRYEHARNIHHQIPNAELSRIRSVRSEEIDRVKNEIPVEFATESCASLCSSLPTAGVVTGRNNTERSTR